jgi:chemotaxis protein MotB
MEIPKPMNITPIVEPIDNPIVETNARGDDVSENTFALTKAEIEVDAIAGDVLELFESLIEDEQIVLRKTPLWLEIEIRSNILFNSGSADLADEAEAILSRLGGLFRNYPNRVIVEGFTDNRPIQSLVYPSNWELSSARAAAVIRLFEAVGIDSIRMSSVGYGEFRPSYGNESEQGRARNRKVIIVVMANIQGTNIQIPAADIEMFRQRGGP